MPLREVLPPDGTADYSSHWAGLTLADGSTRRFRWRWSGGQWNNGNEFRSPAEAAEQGYFYLGVLNPKSSLSKDSRTA